MKNFFLILNFDGNDRALCENENRDFYGNVYVHLYDYDCDHVFLFHGINKDSQDSPKKK